MRCYIYKGLNKPDTYLFLTVAGQFDSVPGELVKAFGGLELVMDLVLTPSRQLANGSAIQVMRDLLCCGYHLQMPPPRDLWLLSDDVRSTSNLH